MKVLTRDVRPYWQHLFPANFGSDDKKAGHLVAIEEVESAAHKLVLAVDQLTHALDAVDDDRLACQYVPFKVPIALEQLALRVSSGQTMA
jgi:hypothetical protein